MITHIWIVNKFRPSKARLIGGGSDLISGMGVVNKLRLKVDF